MEDESVEYYEADRRLRLLASSWGYELSDLDALDMLDYLLQRPDWQTEHGTATDDALRRLLRFYGYDPKARVSN